MQNGESPSFAFGCQDLQDGRLEEKKGLPLRPGMEGAQLEAGTEEDLLGERLQLRVQIEELWTSKETT